MVVTVSYRVWFNGHKNLRTNLLEFPSYGTLFFLPSSCKEGGLRKQRERSGWRSYDWSLWRLQISSVVQRSVNSLGPTKFICVISVISIYLQERNCYERSKKIETLLYKTFSSLVLDEKCRIIRDYSQNCSFEGLWGSIGSGILVSCLR